MHVSDTAIGAALVIFAIVLAAYSQTFPPVPGQQFGAALFPTLVGVGLAGCGGVLFLRGYRAGEIIFSRSEWSRQRGGLSSALAAIATMIVYILAQKPIGFLPVMFVLLMIMFALFKVRWSTAIIAAVLVTLAIDLLFTDLLLVPLPDGIMPRLPW